MNGVINDALPEAEALLVARLGQVTLADLARDFAWRTKALATKGRRPARG